MNNNKRESNIRDGILYIGGDLRKAFGQAFWVILFSVAYLLRDLSGMAMPDLVFTGICGAAFLVTDVGTSLGIYIFTSALTVPHTEIGIIYVLILLAKLVFSGRTQIRGGMLLATLGMLILQLVNILLFSAGTLAAQLYDYGVRMLILCMPLFWHGAEFSAKDYRRALLCYVAGVMLGGTIALILTANSVTWQVLLAGEMSARLGITENVTEAMQTTYNANQLAGMFTIAGAIIIGAMDQKRISALLAFPLLGYSLFIVIMTRSRTGLLMMALLVLIYYCVIVFQRKKFLRGTVTLLAIVLLVVIVLNIFPGAVDAVEDRFTDQEDITNGRSDLFVRYLEAWSEDPWCFFFGYGIGSYSNVVDIWEVPHNAITDILICWGLAGLILILYILFSQAGIGFRRVEKRYWLLALLPAIIAILISMAGQYLSNSFPHMRLCFLLLAAKAFAHQKVEPTNALEE